MQQKGSIRDTENAMVEKNDATSWNDEAKNMIKKKNRVIIFRKTNIEESIEKYIRKPKSRQKM